MSGLGRHAGACLLVVEINEVEYISIHTIKK